MSDQESLFKRSDRQTLVAQAIEAEYARIVTAAGTEINERELSGYLGYAQTLLEATVPGFQAVSWRDQDGREVTGQEACSTDDCCGWCANCDTCHGDGDDQVCSMGHCHECDHVCDS